MDPAARREERRRAAGWRPRVLCLEIYSLGWKTWAHAWERAVSEQGRLDAVHVRLPEPTWMKFATRRLPWPLGRPLVTPEAFWTWCVRRRFGRAITAGNYDLIFVNSQRLAVGLLDACRTSATPLAVMLDTTGPTYMRDLLGQPIPAAETWADERAIYAAATLLAPWSTWAARSLVDDFAVAEDKICVSPPAVDVRRIGPRVDRGAGLPRILFVGNDWERKGGPRLLRWHQKLWRDRAVLHVASARAPVDRSAHNVVWHGPVPNERVLSALLPATDLFCLPTTHDMSPYAVAEAQAAGVPVVASRLAGIPDLVSDGHSGFLLAPGDDAGFVAAVGRLLEDEPLRHGFGAAARQHAIATLESRPVFGRLTDRLIGCCSDPQP